MNGDKGLECRRHNGNGVFLELRPKRFFGVSLVAVAKLHIKEHVEMDTRGHTLFSLSTLPSLFVRLNVHNIYEYVG